MKIISTLASAFLVSPVVYGIAFPPVTLSLINDQTGQSATTTVIADGSRSSLAQLFRNSNIDNNGRILASSAQLIDFVQGLFCVFQKGNIIIPINDEKTFVRFDQSQPALLVDLEGVFLQCEV